MPSSFHPFHRLPSLFPSIFIDLKSSWSFFPFLASSDVSRTCILLSRFITVLVIVRERLLHSFSPVPFSFPFVPSNLALILIFQYQGQESHFLSLFVSASPSFFPFLDSSSSYFCLTHSERESFYVPYGLVSVAAAWEPSAPWHSGVFFLTGFLG